MNYAGYEIDVKWEFWRASGRIRNDMDQSLLPAEKSSRVHEEAASVIAEKINALWVDRLCDPWFS